MSDQPEKTVGAQRVDYDKKFEEDLEKARALSLESLALEKFRLQKELEKLCITSSENVVSTSSGADRKQSNVEKPTNIQLKSRPRPGSFNTGRPRIPKILAPPPGGTRRNSATAAVPSLSETNSTDLINFNSPSPTSKNQQAALLHNLCDAISDTFPSDNFVSDSEFRTEDHKNINSLVTDTLTNSAYYLNRFTSVTPMAPNNVSFVSQFPSALSSCHVGNTLDRNQFVSQNVPIFLANQHISVQQYSNSSLTDLVQTTGISNAISQSSQCTSFNSVNVYSPNFLNCSNSLTKQSVDSSLEVLKVVEKRDNNNLIDLSSFDSLSSDDKTSVRVSVLEAFDPLLTVSSQPDKATNSFVKGDTESKEDAESMCSGSFYDAYDPFDYMYSTSADGSQSDPVYAAVVKERTPTAEMSPPPLPPRNSFAWNSIERRKSSVERKSKQKSRLYENIKIQKSRALLQDADLQAFYKMVKQLRSEFPHSDPYTNVGLVISPTIESRYVPGTSIKLIVYGKSESSPVTFTCDVGTSIEHVIVHVVCELEGELRGEVSDYVLKVWCLAEYFTLQTCLSDYEYIHQCLKLEQDVQLSILHVDDLKRPLLRTLQDDNRDNQLTLEDLVPNELGQPISYDNLVILLQTLEQEMERVHAAAVQLSSKNTPSLMPSLQPKGVIQTVKAICAHMGNIETQEITETIENFKSVCLQFIPVPSTDSFGGAGSSVAYPEITSESGDYSIVTIRTNSARRQLVEDLPDAISNHCDSIRDTVQTLIETYCHAFRVDFQLSSRGELPINTKESLKIIDSVLVHVGGLHRPLQSWNHDQYLIAGQIYHGTRPIGHPVLTQAQPCSQGFYNRILFDFWLNFESTSICMLPLESRLVLVLYGQVITPPDGDSKDTKPQMQQIELGWTSMQFFNFERVLTQGSCLLPLWPPTADKRLGPAPAPGTHPKGMFDPVLWIEIPDYGGRVLFSSPVNSEVPAPKHDFFCLDHNTQHMLLNIIEQDTFSRPPVEEREILWEKRHYLHLQPLALPKVLLAAHSWDAACLGDLHAMLHSWTPLEPVSALQLLHPCFPDTEVRRVAVKWLEDMGRDEIVDFLPQLVQALKHETWETSPLAHFLLKRSLISPRVAHHLYWLLMQVLPGQSPQNSSESQIEDDGSISEARYFRRLQLMLRALFAVSGEALRQRFLSQQLLVKNLFEIAEKVKTTKESLRLKILAQELEVLHHSLKESPTCLPLSPSLEVGGIQVRTCSYFPSNTLPLKINFLSQETGIIPAIFKVGDDLQQDMLTIQMVRIMDKLWLKEGLDLKMVTFSCVPTGNKRGMIEMVMNAETLRKIQVEFGLTGSFKDRPIAEWLAKHNPSAFEYERAVENFTASCAGYSVATYILGICDRHNDNIMLKTSGHLFHIDFGKFLGDAQMFGNFKRDRTPFVLTSDMAYVINGGDKPSAKFHHFVDLCCQAFNVVRKYGNLLLNLFALMVSSGIPGVTRDAVCYVQNALLLKLSNPEAAAMFARMIENSLKSWFTQFNFFLHNLAQLRFTGDHNDGELLSFIPRTYTMQQEGRIKSVGVYGYQKRYDPEKYYVYILRVERVNQPDPVYLFRSYKEFCEFHQKLCILFPLAKCYSLPSGMSMGRSNIKQVAEKRRVDIERFLKSLFLMADEIAHSDLVYTFFHPLLRDQQEANIHARKVKEPKTRPEPNQQSWLVRGQLKLSLHYQRGVLMVMVHHARGLPVVAGGQEPSPYVKVYLLPDPTKATKRKTKVVKKNCHPSFMEMLEYRLPLDVIRSRQLQATVWNHDPLQENEFLGGVTLPLNSVDLSSEMVEWYSLGNVQR